MTSRFGLPWSRPSARGPQVAAAAATIPAELLDENRGAEAPVTALQPSESGVSVERLAPWLLGALLAVGALLRLIDLGQLSFRWDEDLSSLAAKAIAEHGVPELPSGMIYLRSLPFLYLLAGNGTLFGFDEWGLRLPAALFGIASIALAYVLGKRLFGTSVGLALAALVTFSSWDIEFSRYARMYAPFAFFYVVTLLSIWRYLIVERSIAGGLLCLLFALVALSLHDLAYTLAPAFLLPLLIDGRRMLDEPKRIVFPLAGCVSVAAGFLVWGRIQSYYFERAAILAAERRGADAATVAADVPLRTLEEAANRSDGVLALIERIVTQIRLPNLPAFSALFDSAPLVALGAPLVALAAAAAVLVWRRTQLPAAAYVLLPVIALLCGFQLFNLALLATLGLAFTRREGVRAFRAPEVMFAFVLVAAFFGAWLFATVQLDLLGIDGGVAARAKEAIRRLLDYPSFFVFWGFPREYPLTSIAGAIGGLWAFDRIARPRPDPAALFIAAAFALPIVLNGMFETRYQNFRYNVPFSMLFFAFVALGLVKWPELVRAWQGADGSEKRTSSAMPRARVTALLVVLIAAYDMNPLKGWLVTQRDYANEGALYSFFDLRGFRDYRTAASFVDAHADSSDTLITFDCREYYNYLERMDYCIVSGTYRAGDEMIQTYVDDGGVIKDLYVGARMILSAQDLERVLAEAPGDAWLLASDSIFEDEESYDEDLLEFLAARQEHVVHVARDGMTKVYRF